tara:strand:- start:168 stop:1838 length:1671 start_codon:yes stop_codon:yes gene_type:complete
MKSLSPIILFVYNRPYQTMKVLEFLKKNLLSRKSDLIVFSDGSKKNDLDKKKVEIVRIILKNLKGFKSKKIYFRKKNLGLFKNIMQGLDSIFKKYDKAIILEDDLVVNKHFLRYMNKALNIYANNSKVSCISGWFCSHNKKINDTFFLRGSDIWGWATWKRSWKDFNRNPKSLIKIFKNNTNLIQKFNLNNSYNYYRLLERREKKINQSWGILWNASNFLKNKYYLNFSNSLCVNIGQDQSGSHDDGNMGYFNQKLSNRNINLKKQKIEENLIGKKIKSEFFKKNFKTKINIINKINPFKRVYNKIMYRKKIISYSGPFNNWEDAVEKSRGYNSKNILNEVLKNTLIAKNNLYFFERDGSLLRKNTISHNQIYLILEMINKKKRGLNIIDYGGSLGSMYFKFKDIINQKHKNTWNIIEQESYVNIGKKNLDQDNLNFFKNIDTLKNKRIDLVMLCGTLQYLDEPDNILKKIFALKPEIILIEKLPIINNQDSNKIYIQKRGENSYPSWIFTSSYVKFLFKKNNYNLYKNLKPEFEHNLFIKNEKINFCDFIYRKDQ